MAIDNHGTALTWTRLCAVALASACLFGASQRSDEVESAAKDPVPAAQQSGTEAKPFALNDQFGNLHEYAFPKAKVSVLLFADREGSKQVEGWVLPLHERYADRIDIDGIADVHAVPTLMRGLVRYFFKQNSKRPIMLDWEGTVTDTYDCVSAMVNVFVVDAGGTIVYRHTGEATPEVIDDASRAVDRLLEAADTARTSGTKAH